MISIVNSISQTLPRLVSAMCWISFQCAISNASAMVYLNVYGGFLTINMSSWLRMQSDCGCIRLSHQPSPRHKPKQPLPQSQYKTVKPFSNNPLSSLQTPASLQYAFRNTLHHSLTTFIHIETTASNQLWCWSVAGLISCINNKPTRCIFLEN